MGAMGISLPALGKAAPAEMVRIMRQGREVKHAIPTRSCHMSRAVGTTSAPSVSGCLPMARILPSALNSPKVPRACHRIQRVQGYPLSTVGWKVSQSGEEVGRVTD